VHLLRYVVKCSYKFTVEHSSKLFEVSYICLDTFSDSCDQRTSNLTKQCSVEHSSKLFEVSYICLDTFSDSCDQRTSNLTKHSSAVFNIQASCLKCPTSAWIPFLTHVTKELLTLQSTAVQCSTFKQVVRSVLHLLGYLF
jgi:hypothetical protein